MKAPIALFCFNRPDVLSETIDALKENCEASETEILKMLTFFNTFFPETRLYIGLKKFLLSLRKVH